MPSCGEGGTMEPIILTLNSVEFSLIKRKFASLKLKAQIFPTPSS